jgi:hypothetical protein
MRPFPAAAAAAVIAVTTALAVPAGGRAAPAEGVYHVQNVVTGLNAADSGGAVVAHRPKGDEDHQRWRLRAAGAEHVLENTDAAGRCLGRSGSDAVLVACDSAQARWVVGDRTLKDPAADRHLSGVAGSDRVVVGAAGDRARWYLTPVVAPTTALPPEGLRRLDQVTFLTAHNAYANGVDGGFAPPFVNLAPNQARGISQQLADGVRGFMFDAHQTPDGAILCHNSCTLVSRPVALWVDVQRIVDFLRAHPAELATVFLEDHVSPQVLRSELARVTGLADVLHRPDLTGVRERGWPTLDALRAAGDRLLIFSDHSRSEDAAAGLTRDSFGVLYQREWTVENHWSMGPGAGASDWSCYSRWDDRPLTTTGAFRPLFVMNHFRDVPLTGTATTDNRKAGDRAQRFCQPAARAKPNYLAVDHYHLGDPAAAVATLNTYDVTYP